MFDHMPFRAPAATQYAEDVDLLFFALVALTVIFSVLVAGLLLFFTVRYRRGSKVDRSHPLTHNTLLELTWSVGPLVLGLAVFFWAAKLFAGVFAPPPNAKEVYVIGKQWMWHLQHASGIRENNELHIPVDEPVKLVMISQDVIHAFYVPEFRIQRHVEPGRYTTMWFTPNKVGKFHLYCNMYCGTQHSEMGGWVYVMSKASYQKWQVSGGARPVATGGYTSPNGAPSLTQEGFNLYNKYQCNSCHSSEAVQRGRGPSLEGIYGKVRNLSDGRKLLADDGYLRNVVFYPNEYPLAGWPQGMPSYKNVMTEQEVIAVNTYIKSLGVAGSTNKNLGNVYDPANGGAVQSNTSGGGSGSGSLGGMTGTGSGSLMNNQTSQPGPISEDGGNLDSEAPAANTNNQQWRYMYGGDR